MLMELRLPVGKKYIIALIFKLTLLSPGNRMKITEKFYMDIGVFEIKKKI